MSLSKCCNRILKIVKIMYQFFVYMLCGPNGKIKFFSIQFNIVIICWSSAQHCHYLLEFCSTLSLSVRDPLSIVIICWSSAQHCHYVLEFCSTLSLSVGVLLSIVIICWSSAKHCHSLLEFCSSLSLSV